MFMILSRWLQRLCVSPFVVKPVLTRGNFPKRCRPALELLEDRLTPSTPAFASAASTNFMAGQFGSFTVTTIGSPTASIFEAGTLPGGVVFTSPGTNPGTAKLSGTPAAGTGGTYPITLTANNGTGTPVIQNFTLTVNQPVSITSASSTTFTVGTAGVFPLTTSGFPAPTLTLAGAPAFMSINASNQLVGTPPNLGSGPFTFSFTITAGNKAGIPASQRFTLTVDQAPAIVTTSGSLTVGSAGTITVQATGNPALTFSLTGAPAWLSINATTGVMSGTPPSAGQFTFTVTAANGIGIPASQQFTLIADVPMTITPASLAAGVTGALFSRTITVSGGTGNITLTTPTLTGTLAGELTVTASLPSSPAMLTIAGTPNSPGTATLSVTATDSLGSVKKATYVIRINLGLVADALSPGKTMLVFASTTPRPIIIAPVDRSGDLNFTINGVTSGPYHPTGHIIIYGNGNETIRVLSRRQAANSYIPVTTPVILIAGTGNEVLDVSGSTAGNVLVGGGGRDTLIGGFGRDILIGGSGNSTLVPGRGGDVLIRGVTSYDANLAALSALLAEWERMDENLATRLAHLTNGGGLNGKSVLNSTTVTLNGGAAFRVRTSGPNVIFD